MAFFQLYINGKIAGPKKQAYARAVEQAMRRGVARKVSTALGYRLVLDEGVEIKPVDRLGRPMEG